MGDERREPPGFRAVTPYLAVRNAHAEFYRAAFAADQLLLIEEQDGRIGHATLAIGPAEIYLADEHPEFESIVGPEMLGGTSVTLDLEVDDVDAAVEHPRRRRGPIRPPDHPTSGVQAGKVRDPFGHV